MTCGGPVSDVGIIELFVVDAIAFGLLILLVVSRRRYVPGQPGKLPIFSTLSRWVYGTEDPRSLLFVLVMVCFLAFIFIAGYHLTASGPFIYPTC
jgi:hypothetical protein